MFLVFALIKSALISPSRMEHHEMQEEEEEKDEAIRISRKGGPLKSHLQEQRRIANIDEKVQK